MSGPLSAGVMCTVSDVPPKLPFLRVVRGLRSYNITGISDALRRENAYGRPSRASKCEFRPVWTLGAAGEAQRGQTGRWRV